MIFDFADINWFAIAACVVVGQILLTIWFAALFADPWAKAYGVDDKKQHTAEIPPYTYGLGAACVLALSIGLSILQKTFGISTLGEGLALGVFVAVFFGFTTMMPGYAFLKRWSAFVLAFGSQAALILVLSTILVLWP